MKTRAYDGALSPFVITWRRAGGQRVVTGGGYLTWEEAEAAMPDVLKAFLSVARTDEERAEMLAGRFSLRERLPA